MKPVNLNDLINTLAANHNLPAQAIAVKTAARGAKKRLDEDEISREDAPSSADASAEATPGNADAPLRLAQADTGTRTDAAGGGSAPAQMTPTSAGPETAATTQTGLAVAATDTFNLGWLALGGLGVAAAAGGGGGGAAAAADATAPVFSSATTASFAENATGTAYDATADGDSGVTYTLGGTDAGDFSINASTGAVTFASSPNYEAPADDGGNNVYNISVTATDAAGNATSQAVAITVTDVAESLAGQSVIDLGSYGKLIAPVQVEGNWYYHWDRSGNGTSANSGNLNGGVDYTTHNVLDGIFANDISGVANTSVTNYDGNYGTTDTYRYATLNGVRVALPTANGGVAYPQGIDQYQNGTTYTDAGGTSNGTTSSFNELLAIWDAYNGAETGPRGNGTPSGWQSAYYGSATPSTYGHADVSLNFGYVYDNYNDYDDHYVALQVL